MKKISVDSLNHEIFREYGDYVDVGDPRHPFRAAGQPEFYPDRAVIAMGTASSVGISVSIEEKREKSIVEFAEYHQNTGEGFLCLDDDVVMYCAPASDSDAVPVEYLRAFYVPQGTFVTLKPGVWHGCQFPVHKEKAHILIVLPERTYAKDCTCIFFDDAGKLEIEPMR